MYPIGSDLVDLAAQLITADNRLGDRIIKGGGLTNRALVVRSFTQTTLVWSQRDERRTGIPELDKMLASPSFDSTGIIGKEEAANLYALVAELGVAVDAPGEVIGVVGFIYTQCGFKSAFHYPLERYKNDAGVEAFLVDQEAKLRAEQQAIDAASAAEAAADAAAEAATEVLEARLVDEEQ